MTPDEPRNRTDDPTDISPGSGSAAARFAHRARRFGRVLDAAAPRWDAPTPCTGWTVGDVVRHVVETERDFLAKRGLLLGEAPALDDPVAAWHAHAQEVSTLLAGRGVAETEYDGYFGRTTIAATMADFYGWDLVIHGWDVARATGQDYPIDDAEASALSTLADGWGPALHSDGVCAPARTPPDDAGLGDELLARLGRDPRWTA